MDLTKEFIWAFCKQLNWELVTANIITHNPHWIYTYWQHIDWYVVSNKIEQLPISVAHVIYHKWYRLLDWPVILFNISNVTHKQIIKYVVLKHIPYFKQYNVTQYIPFTFNELEMLWDNCMNNLHTITYRVYIPYSKLIEYKNELSTEQKMEQLMYHKCCIRIQRWIKHIQYKPNGSLYNKVKRRCILIS